VNSTVPYKRPLRRETERETREDRETRTESQTETRDETRDEARGDNERRHDSALYSHLRWHPAHRPDLTLDTQHVSRVC
jgi:hypothetical protein